LIICVLSEDATLKEIAGRMAVQCMKQRRCASNPRWQKKVVNFLAPELLFFLILAHPVYKM